MLRPEESTELEFPAGAGRLLTWLANSDWQTSYLLDILSGRSVPGSYAGIEPYEWVLDVFSNHGNPPYERQELAARLAHLVVQIPLSLKGQPQPNKIIYNALSLCAGFHQPEQLAEALSRTYISGSIEGDWDGVSLRGRLRAAIAGNQHNWDYQKTWVDMANGRAGAALPGNRFQAMDAILLMPLEHDEPPLDAIGDGLTGMVRHLDGERDEGKRDGKLLELIERVKVGYRIGSEVIGYLLIIAFLRQWPRWSKQVLLSGLSECWVSEIEDAMEQAEGGIPPEAWAQHVATGVEECFNRHYSPRAAAWFSKVKSLLLKDLNIGVAALAHA